MRQHISLARFGYEMNSPAFEVNVRQWVGYSVPSVPDVGDRDKNIFIESVLFEMFLAFLCIFESKFRSVLFCDMKIQQNYF